MLTFEELIERKRDGLKHTPEEIERIVLAFTAGEMPDYQMAAWLMAAYLNGLDADETVWLTDAMVRSGRTVDLSSIPGRTVDKHSTGGVADTTTLVVAPLVASCGAHVAKMSGRGLGHTGGTLDKLGSIPGFRVDLTIEEFVSQVARIGVAIIGQTPDVDPADKKIYALRDVTGTVPSIPLIVSSIISKKVAGGADAIVLDVKVGSGSFMKTEQRASELAHELVRVGRALGRDVRCFMSSMDQPLGRAVGNALEVREAIAVLTGETGGALRQVCVTLACAMLMAAGVARDEGDARSSVERALGSGAGLERFARLIAAQGGDPRVVEQPDLLPRARCQREVRADQDGVIVGFDAETIGRAAMVAGAGRARAEDAIDPGAGLVLAVSLGDEVQRGDLLCTIHASREDLLDEAEARVRTAVRFGDAPPSMPRLIWPV